MIIDIFLVHMSAGTATLKNDTFKKHLTYEIWKKGLKCLWLDLLVELQDP